jgi:hypothetical protein
MIEELMCSICGQPEDMRAMGRATIEYEKFITKAQPAVRTGLHVMSCSQCTPDLKRLFELGKARSPIGLQPLMVECLRVARINQQIDNAPDVVEAALAEFLRLIDPVS